MANAKGAGGVNGGSPTGSHQGDLGGLVMPAEAHEPQHKVYESEADEGDSHHIVPPVRPAVEGGHLLWWNGPQRSQSRGSIEEASTLRGTYREEADETVEDPPCHHGFEDRYTAVEPVAHTKFCVGPEVSRGIRG